MLCAQENVELLNALLAGNTASVEARTHAAHFDFGQFRTFADLHHLSVYLYRHIKGTPFEEFFPLEFLEHLGECYSQQRHRDDDTLREAALIYDSFRAANQKILFLKGPFIAQQFYGDIHQRTHMDIDILVPREDLPASDKLLKGIGFSRRSLVFLSNDAMTRFTHEYEYHKRIAEVVRPGYRQYLPLDLHWGLQSHFSFRFDCESIWNQQEECSLEGRPFPVLSTEYALVLNVLSIFVDIQLGTIRLKNFVDHYKILEAVDSSFDWDVFFKKRTQENISVITLNVIDLVLSVLDCRSKFPNVALKIDKNRQQILFTDARDKNRLLERSRFAMNNRRWALTLYQAPVPLSLLWTLISIPFRVAAHESRDMGFVRRLRNRKER